MNISIPRTVYNPSEHVFNCPQPPISNSHPLLSPQPRATRTAAPSSPPGVLCANLQNHQIRFKVISKFCMLSFPKRQSAENRARRLDQPMPTSWLAWPTFRFQHLRPCPRPPTAVQQQSRTAHPTPNPTSKRRTGPQAAAEHEAWFSLFSLVHLG